MKKFLRGILTLLALVVGFAFYSCSEDAFQEDGGSQIESVSSTDPSEDPTGSGSGSTGSDTTKVAG